MGQVTITLNGKTYRLECGDGEESHLQTLAEQMAKHVEGLTRKFGQAGDDRLMLMAGLLVADELWEARKHIDQLNSKLSEVHEDRAASDEVVVSAQEELAGMINAAAERIQSLSSRLANGNGKS
jgi:cell division protein ZapA